MSKKVIRQFEEQFGKEWRCQCKAVFEPENLEILSESANSLLAHYSCPTCGREQMLAAAISESEEQSNFSENTGSMFKIPKSTISSDDVLDIKQFIVRMKFSYIKSLGNQRLRRKSPITVSKVTSQKSP